MPNRGQDERAFSSAGEARKANWFSRRHQTDEAHRGAMASRDGQDGRRRRALARLEAQTYETVAGKYEDEMRLDDLPSPEVWEKRRQAEILALRKRLFPHEYGNTD